MRDECNTMQALGGRTSYLMLLNSVAYKQAPCKEYFVLRKSYLNKQPACKEPTCYTRVRDCSGYPGEGLCIGLCAGV